MKNIIKSLMIILAATALFVGCAQKEEPALDPYATNFVYMKAPVKTKHSALFSTAGNWKSQPDTTLTLAQARCTKPAPKDIVVSVEIDESMVETYNTANGTDYKFFPNLELLQDQLVIRQGEYLSADTLKAQVTDFDFFLEGGTQMYVVPVKMTKVSAGQLSESNHFYIFYDAAMLFGQMTSTYTGTKLDRSGWKIYLNEFGGRDVTSTLTDGSQYSDVYNLYGENTLYVDLGQVYDNLVNFGVDHYGASYSCNEIEVEISVDNVEYKSLGVYEAYYMGSAVLEVFDPQQARYVKITGIDPMNSYYGWDIGEINVAVAN